MSDSICERVLGFDVVVNPVAQFATVSGKLHTDQMDRGQLVSRIAFLKREAARPKYGHTYEDRLSACRRALVLMDGGA